MLYLDNWVIDIDQIQLYDGYVIFYMVDCYYDDVIMFEFCYVVCQLDGGWGEYVFDFEVVLIGGEYIQVIDELIIVKVGEYMSCVLGQIEVD